jgi:amidase
VTDNAILLSAMTGEDFSDIATKDNPKNIDYQKGLTAASLSGLRFGVSKDLLGDSLYMASVGRIVALGGTAVEFEPEKITLEGFSTLLSADMKNDLPTYLEKYASENIKFRTVAEIADFNKADSLIRIPYRQTIFDGIIALKFPPEELVSLRTDLHAAAVSYFDKPMTEYNLDAILSINNRNAGMAAAAFYPCLTVPMGYRNTGTPAGITFIGRPFGEAKLLKIGYAFEQATRARKLPEAYR